MKTHNSGEDSDWEWHIYIYIDMIQLEQYITVGDSPLDFKIHVEIVHVYIEAVQCIYK